jgi:ABC-type multidrug transport system ATPase subunit
MGSRTTVLTSHSMEEVQALCTRLAIMINGQLQCIGSPQHLKDRFGSGYNVEIKSSEDMVEIMKDNLPEATLEEMVNGHFKFVIDKKHYPVSHIFETIVKMTRKHRIQEYAVSQSTLEQVR